MKNILAIALAFACAASTTVLAQTTSPHNAPPEAFKYLPAHDVDALTGQTSPGAHTAFPSDHENYFVEYASRNDSGNEVEVHAHWTHYIHILSGDATLTYGGTVAGARNTGPGQVRGSAITGGTSIPVHAGDYMQIPAGMPHLFTVPAGGKLHYIVFNTRE